MQENAIDNGPAGAGDGQTWFRLILAFSRSRLNQGVRGHSSKWVAAQLRAIDAQVAESSKGAGFRPLPHRWLDPAQGLREVATL